MNISNIKNNINKIQKHVYINKKEIKNNMNKWKKKYRK